MKLHEAIGAVNKCWSDHYLPDFELTYEALCGAFVRREVGPISPIGMESELRDARLKLILLRHAAGSPVMADMVFQLADANHWENLPIASSASARAFYCLRETNSSMMTNGPCSIPKTYSFGPWFEPFRRLVEMSIRAPMGLGFRRLHVSISTESTEPQVNQIISSSGELTEIKMDGPTLVKRIEWLVDHAREFHYDQILVPAAIVGLLAKQWRGDPVEIVSDGTRLLEHEAQLAHKTFGSPVIDCMRCWDGGFTFTTIDGQRAAMRDYFCWKVVGKSIYTVDLFNHAKPFVNHASDDAITMDGDRVLEIKKPFEDIDGIDPEQLGETLLPTVGFWQVLNKDDHLYCYPAEAMDVVYETTGRNVVPLVEPIGIGVRGKLYHTANLDVASNHSMVVTS